MDEAPLRIALVSSSFHPHFGGVEEHVRHVAHELRARGHAVEVWTVDRGDGLSDESVEGIRVRYLPAPLPARSARALASFTARLTGALRAWARAMREFRPDVLNVQCFGPNGVYGCALANLTGTPLVTSSHGETVMDEHAAFDRSALLRVGLRRAIASSTVTACSALVANDLRGRFGAGYVRVIPNGVDPVPAVPAASRARPERRPVLLGAGRLVQQKGFDVLLEAAARSGHDPEVWIVGTGAERPRLEELTSALGMTDRVRFLGRRTAAEVQRLMTAADAVVVPSRIEPFGIVVLEAWASGTPVLATTRGGPADIVTDGADGILVDPEDLSSVVSGIDRVLSSPDLAAQLSREGRVAVRSYTWAAVADAYEQVYRDQLTARR